MDSDIISSDTGGALTAGEAFSGGGWVALKIWNSRVFLCDFALINSYPFFTPCLPIQSISFPHYNNTKIIKVCS